MNREKVAALIITYNRKKLLTECVDSLVNQSYKIDEIFIIDNASSDGTYEFLTEQGVLNTENDFLNNETVCCDYKDVSIRYYKLSNNTGCSGGVVFGLEKIRERDFDWVWVMDDDICPRKDTLEKLFDAKKRINEDDIAILMPLRMFEDKPLFLESKEVELDSLFSFIIKRFINRSDILKDTSIASVPFEGPLVDFKLLKKDVLPNKELFIIADDTEFSIKISKFGKFYLIPDAKMDKKLKIAEEKFDWKSYYYIRNLIYIDRSYGKNLLIRYIRPFIFILRMIKNYHRYFFTYKRYFFKSFFDGYLKRLGKSVNPGAF